jgi:hypothetical protein
MKKRRGVESMTTSLFTLLRRHLPPMLRRRRLILTGYPL